MSTSFSSLPIVDLKDLHLNGETELEVVEKLGEQLYDVFATTGFAYLINAPLTFDHDAVFNLTRLFFDLPIEEKMQLAKKAFRPDNRNTYRGYFPVQPLSASNNLKEGFEIGSPTKSGVIPPTPGKRVELSEDNVWPDPKDFDQRAQLEQLYEELQGLSSRLLSLVALSLGKEATFFDTYLKKSLSTLRLLHYPTVSPDDTLSSSSFESLNSTHSEPSIRSQTTDDDEDVPVRLSCTPHTDSGILTLLHQDSTGGLEVKNSLGHWVPAPYIPGSIVVNIGDLMAEASGGRFIATMHRVRAPVSKGVQDGGTRVGDDATGQFGRFSVPFFFEPGENCVVKSVDGDGHGILYGEHVRRKMKTWVEFQGTDDVESDSDRA